MTDIPTTYRELLSYQRNYDNLVYSRYNTSAPSIENWVYATFDELGEVNHALKKEWCWWKNTQEEVDKEALKEELADLLHFLLMGYLEYGNDENSEWIDRLGSGNDPCDNSPMGWVQEVSCSLFVIFNELTMAHLDPFWRLNQERDLRIKFSLLFNTFTQLVMACGFTKQDMIQAYLDKNAVNIQRVYSGY